MATVKKPRAKKHHYTPAEANAMLPLLRSILRDITELACDLRQRDERLRKVKVPAGGGAHDQELERAQADFESDQERLNEYIQELKKLKVELKDPFIGLIDFPCLMNDREVLLCWRLDEPEVAFWHEPNSGFAGRKKIEGFSPQRHRDTEKRDESSEMEGE
jgi:hypothetical protein